MKKALVDYINNFTSPRNRDYIYLDTRRENIYRIAFNDSAGGYIELKVHNLLRPKEGPIYLQTIDHTQKYTHLDSRIIEPLVEIIQQDRGESFNDFVNLLLEKEPNND